MIPGLQMLHICFNKQQYEVIDFGASASIYCTKEVCESKKQQQQITFKPF